jgi:competence protein ComEC
VAEVLARLPPPLRLRHGEGWEQAGVRFTAVSADEDPALVENDASLALRIEHGAVSFLFPGDLEAAGEAAALAAGGALRADLVKVPHHGSRTSSTAPFTQAVSPAWAVVSLGAFNRYGFPHPEAEARWRATGATWLRTDEGAARFLSDGRVLRRVPAGDAIDAWAVRREGERSRASGGAP